VDFVRRGGRWLALHGTNAAVDPPAPGAPRVFSTPDVLGPVADVLGSRFLGHPPIAPYRVEITAPEHPLVAGVGPFEVSDEQYVCEPRGEIEVLAGTDVVESSPGFAEGGTGRQPVLYLRSFGAGQVCYFTLGHCRGRYDIADLGVPDTGVVDRGSWEVPQFREILRRAIRWVRDGA
jgi:type 1 glutamine amidotransferase